MSGTRIPLELIQKVFYDDSDTMSEAQNAFIEGTANDFRVQKNPVIEISREVILPKYPKMDRKILPPNIPSTFYHQKRVLQPEPDPELNYKIKKPRDVIIENLSEDQRELVGLSPYEKDELMIMRRRQNYIDYMKELEKQPKRKPVAITDEEYAKLNHHFGSKIRIQKQKVENVENYQPQQVQFEIKPAPQSPRKKVEIPSMYTKSEAYYLERGQINKYNACRPLGEIDSYLTDDFKPTLETRASRLKGEYIRREMEKVELEETRLKLNAELRKKIEEKAARRISARPAQFNANRDKENSRRKQRAEMRNNVETYNNTLSTIRESLELGKTLIERVDEEISEREMINKKR